MMLNQQAPPTDHKRLLLAVGLSVAVISVWQILYPPAAPKAPPVTTPGAQPQSVATGEVAGATPATPRPSTGSSSLAFAPETLRQVIVPEQFAFEVSSHDGQLSTVDLREGQYRKAAGPDAEAFRFVDRASPDAKRGVFLAPLLNLSIGDAPLRGDFVLEGTEISVVARHVDAARKLEVERVYTVGETPHTLDLTVRLKNLGSAPLEYGLNAELRGAQNDKEAEGRFMAAPIYAFESICSRADGLERQSAVTVAENQAEGGESLPRFTDSPSWAGIDNRYFMTALAADSMGAASCEFIVGRATGGVTEAQAAPGTSYLTTRLSLSGGTVPPGETVSRTFRLYAGPKKLLALDAVGPSLSAAVDFGIFSPICVSMLAALRWFFSLVPNWAVAIVLLTLLVKLLTLPLTHKQYKSMAAMRRLQPELKGLQEKFKDDKMRLQSEMMGLYKKHGVNPFAGCLPLVMMMPIYMALYSTIQSAVELYQAEMGLWIHDLSEPDPFFVLPIILGGFFILQTRLSPPAGDEMQQKMMLWFMPLMFTGMMLFLPAGLVVYILANTLLGIAQQSYMNKAAAAATPVPVAARGRS